MSDGTSDSHLSSLAEDNSVGFSSSFPPAPPPGPTSTQNPNTPVRTIGTGTREGEVDRTESVRTSRRENQRDGCSAEEEGRGRGYSPPSPYTPPSSPSPPASPSLRHMPTPPAQRKSCEPHTPTRTRSRKMERSYSPEASRPSKTSKFTDMASIATTPRSRNRLLVSTPSRLGADGDFGDLDDDGGGGDEHGLGDLLDRADEVLTRLRGKGHDHSLDDLNSDPLNTDFLHPDPTSPQVSPGLSDRPDRRLSHLHVLSRAPAGPHITVTSSEGDRVYLRLRDDDFGARKKGGMACSIVRSRKQLLTVPFAELKASVEDEVSSVKP